jgi:uncharacterized membrane protein (UPF0127 family)
MRSAWLSVLLLTACASGAGSATDENDTTVPVTAAATADATAGDTTTVVTVPAVLPEGFATTQAVVTKADGTTCDLCLWLADTGEQRSQGLMFVTELGRADGMAFRYASPHTGTFWMKDTMLPLSIAFFTPDGGFIESFDMEPCTTDSCPNYATPRDFQVAVEVPQGELADLDLVAGSRLELLDTPCDE